MMVGHVNCVQGGMKGMGNKVLFGRWGMRRYGLMDGESDKGEIVNGVGQVGKPISSSQKQTKVEIMITCTPHVCCQ